MTLAAADRSTAAASTPERAALLVGATGLVGGHCLALLAADPYYRHVTVLVRRRIESTLDAKIDQHVIDFDRLEALPPALRADHVFCALGTTIKQAGSPAAFRKVDLQYPVAIAKLTLDRGAHHCVVVSSLGADRESRVLYARTKGEMEQQLGALPFRALTILRPSLLLGDRKEFRLGEEVAKRFAFLMPLRYKPVHARQVASAMIAAAREDRPGIRILESSEIQRMRAVA